MRFCVDSRGFYAIVNSEKRCFHRGPSLSLGRPEQDSEMIEQFRLLWLMSDNRTPAHYRRTGRTYVTVTSSLVGNYVTVTQTYYSLWKVVENEDEGELGQKRLCTSSCNILQCPDVIPVRTPDTWTHKEDR